MTNTQGRRPDGPGWYWYTGEPCMVYAGPEGRLMMVMFDDTPDPVDICIGDFVPLTKPVAAPEPDEDREPSWQDYAALSLHDLAWLREMAEEYEWSHRADPGVDMERVRMVISRMTIALHKRKKTQSE